MKKLWQRRPPKPDTRRFTGKPYHHYAPTALSIMFLCLLFLAGGLWLGNRVAEQRQQQPETMIVTTFYQHKAAPITVTARGYHIQMGTEP